MLRPLPPDAVGFALVRFDPQQDNVESPVTFPAGSPGAANAFRLYQHFGWIHRDGRYGKSGRFDVVNADGNPVEQFLISNSVDYRRIAGDLPLINEEEPPPVRLSVPQQILLRQLGGELVPYNETRHVRITEPTYRSLIRLGLIERGCLDGGFGGVGCRITVPGRHQAFRLSLARLDQTTTAHTGGTAQ